MIGIAFLGYYPSQSDFYCIFLGFSVSFGAYFILTFILISELSIKYLKWVAAIIPLILVFSEPNLSDDIFRFIWDGLCTLSRISPYRFIPRDVSADLLGPQQQFLFEHLNSPDYFSVYPTISQAFFALIVKLTGDFYFQIVVLKIMYYALHLLGAIAICKVFNGMSLNVKPLALYYLNPLVIVEGIGNLHAEINMVSFLFISLYLWYNKKYWFSAFMYACAINVKLIPIFFLGYFLVRYQNKKMISFLLKVGLFSFLLFLPVIYGLINGGFLESIDLYFRKFEFNASVYYSLREIGDVITGYNLIAYLGPILFLAFIFISFYKWWKENESKGLLHFMKTNERVMIIYLLLSTIVHPWYIIPLLGINVFLRRRYIIVWSYLISLTYINYSYNPYSENMWVVFLEYGVVFMFGLYEYKNREAQLS